MTPAEIKTIEKTLDILEAGFLGAEMKAVKEEVLPELEHDVERIFRDGKIDAGSFELPGKKRYKRLFQRFLWECWAQGYKLAWDELKAKEKTANYASSVTPDPVIPEDAIKKIDLWTDRFGDSYYGDATGDVVNVLRNSLREGMTTKETMEHLSEYLSGPGYNRGRLETIARTNATTFFNQGRLEQFRQNSDFVSAVEYNAILDSRTTQICRDRDGKVMRLDAPELEANTPPLHYKCRSILSPVVAPEWEEMQKPGWRDTLGKAGHNRTLAEKMDWETGENGGKMTSPAQGFGQVLNIEKTLKKQAESGIIEYIDFEKLSEEEAKKWLKSEHWQQWWDSLTEEEQKSFKDYTHSSYTWINDYLRGKQKLIGEQIETVERLKKAINKGKCPDNIICYRWYGNKQSEEYELAEKHGVKFLINKEIKNPAFQSTSLTPLSINDGKILAKIKVPKGMECGSGFKSVHSYELEVLLKPEITWKVINAEIKDDILYLEVDIIE